MKIFSKLHKLELNDQMKIELAPGVSVEFIRIPAGKFIMGSKKSDRFSDHSEYPQHKVFLDEYFKGRFPITNIQYQVFIGDTANDPPNYWLNGQIPYTAEQHPVHFLSWLDAIAFCEWISLKSEFNIRLPSEAEWEKAARGTDGRKYPWGNNFDTEKANKMLVHNSWSQKKGGLYTSPVGNSPKTVSPSGCEEMAAVIPEWVNDWYDAKYYLTTPDRNPKGPPTGSFRVCRNGEFATEGGGRIFRTANRYHESPTVKLYGFRCAFSFP